MIFSVIMPFSSLSGCLAQRALMLLMPALPYCFSGFH